MSQPNSDSPRTCTQWLPMLQEEALELWQASMRQSKYRSSQCLLHELLFLYNRLIAKIQSRPSLSKTHCEK